MQQIVCYTHLYWWDRTGHRRFDKWGALIVLFGNFAKGFYKVQEIVCSTFYRRHREDTAVQDNGGEEGGVRIPSYSCLPSPPAILPKLTHPPDYTYNLILTSPSMWGQGYAVWYLFEIFCFGKFSSYSCLHRVDKTWPELPHKRLYTKPPCQVSNTPVWDLLLWQIRFKNMN